MSEVFHWANLTLAFLLELCALAALGYWGVSVGGPLGYVAAPRATVSVPLLGLGVKLIVFGSAVVALYATGHRTLAIVFAVIVVANGALMRLG
ncbi:MAG TPA: DUF2568 domain-containing protein [Rubrobacter sp.]|nr:DUF2568 domain-containing protein [Rubrobacter sp.]